MKSRTLKFAVGIVLLAAPVRLAAQQHHHYKLIDLGTLGGPASYFLNGSDGILNNQGTAVSWSDTSTPDPFPAFCFNPDCFVSHAFQSRNGVRTDLRTLPGGASSQAFWISANGLIAGIAQNGQIDPLIPGLPEVRAVLWQNGSITDLGTLDGGTESLAMVVNTEAKWLDSQALTCLTNLASEASSFGPFCGKVERCRIWALWAVTTPWLAS